MKRYPFLLALLIIIVSFVQTAFAQGWQPVGPNELNKITCTNSLNAQMAINKRNGHVFVGYEDATDSGKITVKKFDGTTWTSLGHINVYWLFFQFKMTVDDYDDVYVMYDDPTHDFKATVQVYNGTKWTIVGYPGFSNGPLGSHPFGYDYNITLDTNGYPYVVYADSNLAGKVTVKRYYGGAWITVGSRGFSAGYIYHPTIKIDHKTNLPFIAYQDDALSRKIAVMHFDGTSWSSPGPPAASDTFAIDPSLVIDSNSIPYVAYNDLGAGDSITVKTLNHSSWHTVGTRGIPMSSIGNSDIALDKNGQPYLLTVNYLLAYNGSSWDVVSGTVPNVISNGAIQFTKDNDLYLIAGDKAYKSTGTAWQRLDTAGISNNNVVQRVSSVTDTSGNLYVCYATQNNRVYVARHTTTGWQDIDSGLYYSGYTYSKKPSIAIDNSTNQPYISFVDTNSHAIVMRYNGISWQHVSSIGSSSDKYFMQELKISNNGKKYFLCQNFSDYSIQVYKYTGSVWTRVGLNVADSIYYYTASLAIDNDTPYVAYINNIGTIIVKKYNSGSWDVFGDSIVPVPHYLYNDLKLTVDNNNTPYLAYTSYLNRAKADTVEVLRWEKTHWRHLHTPIKGVDNIQLNDLLLDNTDHPIISCVKDVYYDHYPFYSPTTIMRYNGAEWKNIGDTNATPGNAEKSVLALTKNNTLYNTYLNTINNGWGDVFVRQYINIPTDTVIDTGDVVRNVRLYKNDLNIYPTPCHNYFMIKNWNRTKEGTYMQVYDIFGRVFRSLPMTKNKVNTADWPAGLYLIETDTGYSAKVIKQ